VYLESTNLEMRAGVDDICIRVQEGGAGRGLGRIGIDRLVEVRSNCDYSTLNCSHTLRKL
jgi:hypothetical protein